MRWQCWRDERTEGPRARRSRAARATVTHCVSFLHVHSRSRRAFALRRRPRACQSRASLCEKIARRSTRASCGPERAPLRQMAAPPRPATRTLTESGARSYGCLCHPTAPDPRVDRQSAQSAGDNGLLVNRSVDCRSTGIPSQQGAKSLPRCLRSIARRRSSAWRMAMAA